MKSELVPLLCKVSQRINTMTFHLDRSKAHQPVYTGGKQVYTAGQLLRTDNTIIHSNHKMKGSKMWKISISAGY
ncbi:hypothetical protein TNCV_2726161 [Trichonephila clavipes]|nr:hypothetical protein TNCV_2726161 [Trichonephila clavipes]